MSEVFGFLNNMSFPRNLYQFERNMETEYFNVEHVLGQDIVGWTVDRNAQPGQLCFWMHTSNTITHINNIRQELLASPNHPKFNFLMHCLDKAESLYDKYGGKIFAIGRVVGEPFEEKNEDRDYIHWTSKFYGPIYTFYHLKNPISKDKFSHVAEVAQKGAITNLSKQQCEELLKIINNDENIDIPLVDDDMVDNHFCFLR